jgi:hypothetical protein
VGDPAAEIDGTKFMSDPQPQARRTPTWLSVLMILLGVILLLPGACAAFFVVAFTAEPTGPFDSVLIQLWLGCFAISAGGIALIWLAVRQLRA